MNQPLATRDMKPIDFARPVLERQSARLERLAEIGMEIAEGLGRLVAAAQGEDAAPIDPTAITVAFSRVSRSVRMSMALQNEVLEQLRRCERIEEAAGREIVNLEAERTRRQAEQARRDRKVEIAQGLTDAIAREHQADEGGEAHERHVREARERLKDADDLGDILGRPVEEVIAQICKDLGLGVEEAAPASFSSPASGGGGPAQPVEGAQPQSAASPDPEPPNAPSVTALARRDASPASEGGEEASAPYIPPPDPDILPGHPVGLPGELPPSRSRRPYWR